MTAFLTPSETAALLKISERTLRRLAAAGLPPRPVRIGDHTIRYAADEIAALASPPETGDYLLRRDRR